MSITNETREARASGLRYALEQRSTLKLRYRELLIEHGPHTDRQAGAALGCDHNSIAAIRKAWGPHVVSTGKLPNVHKNGSTTYPNLFGWVENPEEVVVM